MRRAPEITLDEAQRVELLAWSRSQTLPVRQVSRAKIVLLAADGQEDIAIAAAVGCARQRCARVWQRFLREGLEGLRRDAPSTGRPAKHDAQRIVTLTTTTQPAQATDWSRDLEAKSPRRRVTRLRSLDDGHFVIGGLNNSRPVYLHIHFGQ